MKIRILLIGLLCLFTLPAQAELEINVTGATRDPMPIAFPEMIDKTTSAQWFGTYADKIRDVVLADLERSGLFRLIDENSYIEDLTSINQKPTFIDWQAIKTHALIQGAVTENPDGKLTGVKKLIIY